MVARTPLELLSSNDQKAWQESLNLGASNADIANWFKQRDANPEATKAAQAAWETNPDRFGKASLLLPYLDPKFVGYGTNVDAMFDSSQQQDPNNWLTNMNDVLRQAKNFDPNAKLDENFQLQMDRSKLPAFPGSNALVGNINKGSNGAWQNLTTMGGADRVKNPSTIMHSVYGSFTPRSNLDPAEGDKSTGFMGALEKYMPTVIGSVMALASGGAMSPGLLQMAASLASGDADLTNILSKLAGAIANQYVPGSGTAINLAAGSLNRGN